MIPRQNFGSKELYNGALFYTAPVCVDDSDKLKDPLAAYGVLPGTRFDGGLESRMRCWVRFLRGLRGELLRPPFRLPLRIRLDMLRQGFTSRSWVLYQLDRNDPGEYLTDLSSSLWLYRVNGLFNFVLGDKLVLSRLLAAHGLPHPSVVSVVMRGRLFMEEGGACGDLAESLRESLDRFPRQVWRPTWSGGGQGIFFLRREEGGLSINGRECEINEVVRIVSGLDRYVVTEEVEQGAYAKAIFPGSTNTLRVLTLWNRDQASPHVAAVSHRFGSSRSAPLDNWHQGWGGIVAGVGRDDGVLGRGVTVSENQQLQWHDHHPETGVPLAGVRIDGYRACIDGLVEAATCFPFCPCIGWDVVITDSGYRILEANPLPGMWVWQVHEPLLRDPLNRAFFEAANLGQTRPGLPVAPVTGKPH